jgi:AAA15 family ATPase/GTPase
LQRDREFFDNWAGFSGVTDSTGVNLTQSQHSQHVRQTQVLVIRSDYEESLRIHLEKINIKYGENGEGKSSLD